MPHDNIANSQTDIIKRRLKYAAQKRIKSRQQSEEQLRMQQENHSGNDCSPTSLDSKASEEIKNVLVIANHRQLIMTKLSSLWRKKQLCDAGISNGTSTVKVHKVVLSAVCPTLISTFGTGTLSKDYIQVNFPKEVSMEALNAFAEYMYNGILDLNYNILKQLKIIANKLDMKEFEQLCHSRLLKKSANAAKRPFVQMAESTPMISLLNTIHESPVSMDSGPSVTTPVVNTNQESTQHELRQVKMETDHMFGQESEAASLAQNKSGNSAGVAIYPSVKIESVEPKDNKYGHLSSRSHQVLTSANSTSSSASTSISSVPTSSTEFSIPFSQSTYCKRIKLKPMHSYETPLVSDVSPVSCVGEPVCSPSIPMKEESSKQLSRHSLPTSSLQPQSTSTNNQVMYPEASFTASADNQSFMRFTNVIANTPQSQSSKPLNRQSTSTSSVDISSTTTDNAGIYPVALFMAGGDSVSLLTPNAESIGE